MARNIRDGKNPWSLGNSGSDAGASSTSSRGQSKELSDEVVYVKELEKKVRCHEEMEWKLGSYEELEKKLRFYEKREKKLRRLEEDENRKQVFYTALEKKEMMWDFNCLGVGVQGGINNGTVAPSITGSQGRRPSGYDPSLDTTFGPSQPIAKLNLPNLALALGSADGLNDSDQIFVGGFPHFFTDAQTKELLEPFGPLRCLDLVKNQEPGNSTNAFCVYQDVSVTIIACAALNRIWMGKSRLTVRRVPKSEQENALLLRDQLPIPTVCGA